MNRTNWCDLMVNLHRLQRYSLISVHAWRILDRLVKELSLILMDIRITMTPHHYKVILPAFSHLEMLFHRWISSWLSFFERHSGLQNLLFYIVMGHSGKFSPKLFHFWDMPWIHINDAGQLICWIAILYTEGRGYWFRFLIKIFSEKSMELIISTRSCHKESVVPSFHITSLLLLLDLCLSSLGWPDVLVQYLWRVQLKIIV